MNLIDQKFSELRSSGKTALIPFLTIGDPDLDTSLDILGELEAAGADMVELGVPYSDPLADGPVIQRASERALLNGVRIVDCIAAAGKARRRGIKLPFILFTYYNPVLQLGFERFFNLLRENGISGIIIPDLPVEEDGEARDKAREFDIHLIPLVAPTSQQRIKHIVSRASGFVYCVSSLGVTGMRSRFAEGVDEFISSVKRNANVPVCVGFGISSGDQVRHFAKLCDGAVVGSAIVRKIEKALPLLKNIETKRDGLLQIRQFVAQLKE